MFCLVRWREDYDSDWQSLRITLYEALQLLRDIVDQPEDDLDIEVSIGRLS